MRLGWLAAVALAAAAAAIIWYVGFSFVLTD
jgi:hypothetical protein